MDGDLRLNVADDYEYFGGNTEYDDAYYIGGASGMGLIRGRVEVCRNSTQTWGIVCDDDWTNLDASVACRQIGFSPYGIYYLILLISVNIYLSGAISESPTSLCRCYCYQPSIYVPGVLKGHSSDEARMPGE